MSILLLVVITNPSVTGTIGGVTAGGYSSYLNISRSSTLGGYIRLGIHGFLITPELLSYTLNLGLQHNTSKTVVSSTRLSKSLLHVPYAILFRFQPNHFVINLGHQKQTVRKRFWEDGMFSEKYLGISKMTWGRFSIGTWLNVIYSHETLRSNEPTNRRNETFNSFSVLTYHENKTMNLSNRLLYHSYKDEINAISRKNVSYYVGYRVASGNYIFRNNGVLNWESTNRLVGFWNSFIQKPYKENAYFGLRIGERVVLISGKKPTFGTTFGIIHNRIFSTSLRTRQYLYAWSWIHQRSVKKALFNSYLKYSKKLRYFNFKLSPGVSVFHGIWNGNPGDEIRFYQGLGFSPHLPLSFVYLDINAYMSRGIRAGYLYVPNANPWDVRFIMTSRAMTRRIGGISLQWEMARGVWGGEPQVYPYSYTRWRLILNPVFLPVMLNFQESIDHQYKGWSQTIWLSLRRQIGRNFWVNYVQVFDRSNYQGTPRRYWEHKLRIVARFFMLRINAEALYKMDFLSKGWTGNYKVELTRSI